MAWKKGPLPPGTWMWGGVVKVGETTSGFCFADFHGDYVECFPDGTVLKAEEVAWYDNSLALPIGDSNITQRAK